MEFPVCRAARERQKGLAYWFVRHPEGGICPSCKAYERVYGQEAREPIPAEQEVDAMRRPVENPVLGAATLAT